MRNELITRARGFSAALTLTLSMLGTSRAMAEDGRGTTEGQGQEKTTSSTGEDPKALAPDQIPRVSHQPIASAPADTALVVRATLAAPYTFSEVTLHYRPWGQREFHNVPFALTSQGWYAAQIPASEMVAGVIEYYIGSTRAAAPAEPERLHFASPAAPHPLIVEGDEEVRRRRELLAFHLGNRSRFMLDVDYVDFGQRTLSDGTSLRDNYVRVEGDYTYRILSIIYSIRLGVGLYRGDTYVLDFDPTTGQQTTSRPAATVGLTYGFAEVRFRLGRLARFDLRATLGAGPLHFDGGAGAMLLIGHDPGTHFALGVDGISSIGLRAWAKLAWNTVPHVPMSFTVEATNLPLGTNLGGRVFLTAEYRLSRHVSVTAHAGYAFRDFRLGGPVAGAATIFEF